MTGRLDYQKLFKQYNKANTGSLDWREFNAAVRKYCELQYKCQLFPEFSIENAEIVENCPCKMMICIERRPIIFQFEVWPRVD